MVAAVGEAKVPPVSEGKLVNGNSVGTVAVGTGDEELYSAPANPGVTVRGMLISLFAILPIGLSQPFVVFCRNSRSSIGISSNRSGGGGFPVILHINIHSNPPKNRNPKPHT